MDRESGNNQRFHRELLRFFAVITSVSLLLCLAAGGILVLLGKASGRYLAVVPTRSRCHHSVQDILVLPEYGLAYPGATVNHVEPPHCQVTLHSATLTATT